MVNSGDNESNIAIIEQQKSGLQDAADEILYTTELLMHIFEKNPDALLICDENGKIVLVNSQLELLSGYHRSELKGQFVDLLVPESIKDRHIAHRRGYVDDPRLRPMGFGQELKLQRKNKMEVPVQINLSPVATPRGMFVFAAVRRTRQ